MEPLSGAANVIAVASLAIQLAESAHKIHKSLETIKDAPTQVLGLKKDIVQLSGLLEGVALLTERQNAQDQAPSTPILLHSILQTCQARLKTLEDETSLLQKATEQHGLRYILGALKIPDKNDKIAKAHSDIQNTNQNLHMAMTINLTTLSLKHLEDNKLIMPHKLRDVFIACMNSVSLTPRERLRVVAFLADAFFGHERPGVLAEPWIGLLLVDLTIYECEFEEVWRSWLEMLNEKGHNLPMTSSQFLEMIEGVTRRPKETNTRPRRLVSVNGKVNLEREYNHQEPAYELCREFEHLTISEAQEKGDWPYYRHGDGHEGFHTYLRRVPRSFRKAKAREKKELLRAQRSRSMMPGTFPTESEHDALCEVHWTVLDYGRYCGRCSAWKNKKAWLLIDEEERATLSPFGPPRPTDATIA